MGDVMLLFGNSEKRDPVQVAQIRAWVAELLPVPEDAFVMVKQMECPEEGCPPVETIIAILCNHTGPKQWKLPKPMRVVTRGDIEGLCSSTGNWTPQEWRCPD
jgi:hypothetical protein